MAGKTRLKLWLEEGASGSRRERRGDSAKCTSHFHSWVRKRVRSLQPVACSL